MDDNKFRGLLEDFCEHLKEYCHWCESYNRGICKQRDCILYAAKELPKRNHQFDKFFKVHEGARAMTKKPIGFPGMGG
jgi:hypothetical protein